MSDLRDFQSNEILQSLRELAEISVEGAFDESVFYGLYNELYRLHREKTSQGFVVFPQLTFPWKYNGEGKVIPDFSFGRLVQERNWQARTRIQGGSEIKPPVPGMQKLPEVTAFVDNTSFRDAVNSAAIQASDQVKAAIKSGALPSMPDGFRWMIGIGPYFLFRHFGPFSQEALETRGHRPNDSGDARIADMLALMKGSAKTTPILEPIFCIGTTIAAEALHEYFETTIALYNAH